MAFSKSRALLNTIIIIISQCHNKNLVVWIYNVLPCADDGETISVICSKPYFLTYGRLLDQNLVMALIALVLSMLH